MNIALILLLVVGFFAFFAVGFFLLTATGGGNVRGQVRNIVAAQREGFSGAAFDRQERKSVLDSAAEAGSRKVKTSRLTLQKRLTYAQWKLAPTAFRVLEVVVSLLVFAVVQIHFSIFMQLLSLLSGPLFMRWLLNLAIDRRFKAFDADYPQMLLSLVGLLKTGMNVMGALEAAAEGLDEGSLVKQEVELMIERLRFGVSEDRSIGSFGEDVFHPEIELFVQALLLSRRVGGNLSDTLDRLAKQVRKRQYFRASANAAVGMQRGSIWFIIGILCFLEIYLYIMYPQSVIGAWGDELGWAVWQGGITCVLLGIYWVRQVTKIRV